MEVGVEAGGFADGGERDETEFLERAGEVPGQGHHVAGGDGFALLDKAGLEGELADERSGIGKGGFHVTGDGGLDRVGASGASGAFGVEFATQ